MLKTALLLSILSISLTAFSKILLISDIDDTIKRTNVNQRVQALTSILREDSRFTGISELYQKMLITNPLMKIYYVSGAPELIMEEPHEEFLENGRFPVHGLVLRKSGKTQDFKVKAITDIIQSEKPTRVILVGDNGEYDSQVYKTIQNYFPEIDIKSYIHLVLSPLEKPIESGQTAYAYTPEIAYHMWQLNLITQSQFEKLTVHVNRRLPLEERVENFWHLKERSFPNWMNCAGHRFEGTGPGTVQKIQSAVVEHCKLLP